MAALWAVFAARRSRFRRTALTKPMPGMAKHRAFWHGIILSVAGAPRRGLPIDRFSSQLLVDNGGNAPHFTANTASPSASARAGLLFGRHAVGGRLVAQYSKPYLSVDEQLALLESRGMIVPDKAKAKEYLARIGYYRLSAYWFPFRETGANPGKPLDTFKDGTSFKWVLDLYAFDKMLRLQMLDALERIEIFIRTGIALRMGKFDPLAHRDPNLLFKNFVTKHPRTGRVAHTEWLQRLDEKAVTSKEEFAVHFREKYPTSHMPIWVAVELLDYGPLSHFLTGMRRPDQQAIALTCDVPKPDLLTTWIRSLSVVRNVCAHHARLWNRPLVDQPKMPAAGAIPLLDHLASSPHGNRRLYAACAIARYLLLSVNPRTKWPERLKVHIGTFPENPYFSIRSMGFPDDWKDLDLWKLNGNGSSG
jgi:abortive infection bacteriophage resistance protein